MKKYTKSLVIIGFAIFAVPQIAFASWWNPFSWFGNSKPVEKTKVEVLEKRIKELEESKLRAVAPTPTTTVPVTRKELKKSAPAADGQAVVQAQAKARAQAEATLRAKATQDALIASQKAQEQAKIDAQKAEADRRAAEATRVREAAERASLEALDAQTRALEAQVQKAREKSAAMDAVNLKIANLNAKYASDVANARSASGGTTSGTDAVLRSLFNRYDDEYNALMAEFQQLKYSN